MNVKKFFVHIRFWVWGAMHYSQFDKFQILLLLPVRFAPWFYNKETREIILLIGLRLPRIYVVEPSLTDIHINNPWDKLPPRLD